MRLSLSAALMLLVSAAFPQTAPAAMPIGEVHSPDAALRGSVVLESGGAKIMSGAQIIAGRSTAEIKLARGGNLAACPGASLTITSGNGGREMLVALNAGAIEINYALASSADTILTPDFRIMLAGPGIFRFAIANYPHGDMCVQSLPGNTSSIIVNEQFGEGANQVKPGEQIIFHQGHVDDSASNTGASCGCPPNPAAPTAVFKFPEQQSLGAQQAVAAGKVPEKSPGISIPPTQAIKPGQTYTQIDAPIIFHGENQPPPQPSLAAVKRLAWPNTIEPMVPMPPAAKEKKKWYQKFGSALSSIFGAGRGKK